jgi:hypothetical protein
MAIFGRRKPRKPDESDMHSFTMEIDGKPIVLHQRVVQVGLFPLPKFIRRWAGFPD